jgi:hypothetical protein
MTSIWSATALQTQKLAPEGRKKKRDEPLSQTGKNPERISASAHANAGRTMGASE